MMGSGKSTIGKRLAKRLNLQFYDSDKVLEETEGITVPEIQEFMGQKYLEQKEVEIIKEILGYGTVVLSIGADVFMNSEIRNTIKNSCISIWLDIDVDVIYQRAMKKENKPEILLKGNPRENIEKILKEREPFFQQTDIRIQSTLESHHMVDTIIKRLEEIT